MVLSGCSPIKRYTSEAGSVGCGTELTQFCHPGRFDREIDVPDRKRKARDTSDTHKRNATCKGR